MTWSQPWTIFSNLRFFYIYLLNREIFQATSVKLSEFSGKFKKNEWEFDYFRYSAFVAHLLDLLLLEFESNISELLRCLFYQIPWFQYLSFLSKFHLRSNTQFKLQFLPKVIYIEIIFYPLSKIKTLASLCWVIYIWWMVSK